MINCSTYSIQHLDVLVSLKPIFVDFDVELRIRMLALSASSLIINLLSCVSLKSTVFVRVVSSYKWRWWPNLLQINYKLTTTYDRVL